MFLKWPIFRDSKEQRILARILLYILSVSSRHTWYLNVYFQIPEFTGVIKLALQIQNMGGDSCMCFRPPGAAKNVKCPGCGMFNKPDALKCRKCGGEMPIYCPECGLPQPRENKVCGNCGFNGKPGSGDPTKRKQG